MRKICLSLIVLTALAGHAHADTTISLNVGALAGADKATVTKAIGQPERCEPSKYGDRCTYKGGHQIVFISGAADWFTVYGDAPFSADAVKITGLDPMAPPSTANSNVISWKRGMAVVTRPEGAMAQHMRPGETATMMIEAISVFPSGPKTYYVYVKASTP